MKQIIYSLMLIMSVAAFADPDLNKYERMSEVPESFKAIADPIKMVQKIYEDDDGNKRADKIYYTVYESFESVARPSDLKVILDPANGKLDSIFEQTTVKEAISPGSYGVTMVISTPLKNFVCENTLTMKMSKEGNKEILSYVFSDFNMVFTDMVIRVEIDLRNGKTWVTLRQLAALKGSTYEKLDNFWAVGKFEKSLKSNIKSFKQGVFGI